MAFQKENVIYGRGRTNNYGTPSGLIIHTYASSIDLQAVISSASYFDDFLGETAEDVKIGDLIIARDSANSVKTYRIDTLSPMAVTSISTDANPFNQDLNTTDAVIFTTVDTGQGANELYAMNQNVKTTDSPTFGKVTTTTGIALPTSGGTPTDLIYYEEYSNTTFTFGASPWASPIDVILRITRTNETVVMRLALASAAATTSDFISSTDTIPTQFRPLADSWTALIVTNNGVFETGRAKITTGGIIQIFSGQNDGNFDTPSTAGWSTSTITYFIQDT